MLNCFVQFAHAWSVLSCTEVPLARKLFVVTKSFDVAVASAAPAFCCAAIRFIRSGHASVAVHSFIARIEAVRARKLFGAPFSVTKSLDVAVASASPACFCRAIVFIGAAIVCSVVCASIGPIEAVWAGKLFWASFIKAESFYMAVMSATPASFGFGPAIGFMDSARVISIIVYASIGRIRVVFARIFFRAFWANWTKQFNILTYELFSCKTRDYNLKLVA